jgi:hypothetical protein
MMTNSVFSVSPTVQITATIELEINGTKLKLSLEDAREIYAALGAIVNPVKSNNLIYPPGVRSSDAIGYNLNDMVPRGKPDFPSKNVITC